jgi:hypothetical protein
MRTAFPAGTLLIENFPSKSAWAPFAVPSISAVAPGKVSPVLESRIVPDTRPVWAKMNVLRQIKVKIYGILCMFKF